MTTENREPTFDELLNAEEDRVDAYQFQPGETVAGKVVMISGDTVFIDYGGKAEAWAELEQFKDESGEAKVAPGDAVELKMLEMTRSGMHLGLHFTVGAAGGVGMLKNAHEASALVTGNVVGINKGGFEVEFSGTRAFCPFSQMDIAYVEDTSVFLGTTQEFKVIEFDSSGRRIVVSRRAVLEEERAKKAEETRARLEIGADFDGAVVRLTEFGAFVDFGGIEGMVHVSQISRKQVANPGEVLKIGDKVRVRVVKLEKDAKGKERIGLSMRELEPDPWQQELPFQEGDRIQGVVRRLETFGAFVEIAPGVDGLVHVSEIAREHVAHPKDKLAPDQTVEVEVIEIDIERRRVGLSIKRTLPLPPKPETPVSDEKSEMRAGNVIRRRKAEDGKAAEAPAALADGAPAVASSDFWKEAEEAETAVQAKAEKTDNLLTPRIGLVLKGIVRTIKPYGVFIDLPQCGARASGLLHNSELQGGDAAAKALKDGQELDVEIIRIDEKGRVSLSQQSLVTRREREEVEHYMKKTGGDAKLGGRLGDLLKNVKLDKK
ncbi:MAG: S1 RNA-binding domain-containing protein [Myxococcales bacterium]|nr:MAG: S1 RNA-binding domain-containing protein [Myxococcales bacterium]